MSDSRPASDVLTHVIGWAERQQAVRAVLLTGSRARPGAPLDALSDYDVILVVPDIRPWIEDKSWLAEFGRVLVAYWDPVHVLEPYGVETVGSVLLFEDGLHIDFTLWPVELVRHIAAGPDLPDELDAGYTLLLDKDGIAAGLQRASYSAFVPHPPSREAFQKTVEEFFSDVPYVAKCLWRDELLPAKWCLDYDMKHVYLRPMLEWRIECDHGWSLPAGVLGRGLKRRLPPDLWSELERSYAGGEIEDIWETLFRTIALFRRAATEVAGCLGYRYPVDMDERVTAYARQVRLMAPGSPRR